MNSLRFYHLWDIQRNYNCYAQDFSDFCTDINMLLSEEQQQCYEFDIMIWFENPSKNKITKQIDELFAFVEEEIYE